MERRVQRDCVEGRVRQTGAGVVPRRLQPDGAGGQHRIGIRVRGHAAQATGDGAIAAAQVEQTAGLGGQAGAKQLPAPVRLCAGEDSADGDEAVVELWLIRHLSGAGGDQAAELAAAERGRNVLERLPQRSVHAACEVFVVRAEHEANVVVAGARDGARQVVQPCQGLRHLPDRNGRPGRAGKVLVQAHVPGHLGTE